MATDANNDGVAEETPLFTSLGKYESEPTGFKADPRNPFTCYVIPHPGSIVGSTLPYVNDCL